MAMKHWRIKGALLAAAAGTLLGLAPAQDAAAQAPMKIGLATINDVQHEFAKRFAARMQAGSPKALKIEVYPSEQLGSIPRMIEGLTLGTVEAWIGPPEFLVGIDPRYQIMGAPGVVADMNHAERLAGDAKFREALLSFGDARGVKGIGAVVYGPNLYGTRKPIRAVKDFEGMKIRVFGSPMHTTAMQKLGATGVPMNPADALQALQSGAIDANRTGMNLLVAFKYFDVVKYTSMFENDAMIFSIFVVGKNWFDRQPAATQKAMLEAAKAVERETNQFAIDGQTKSEAAWKERGAELIKVGGAEHAEFVKRMLSVGEEVAGKNPRIKDAYALMLERAKATAR